MDDENKITDKELKQLLEIAKKNIVSLKNRTDLERHFNGEEDFFEIAIWELKEVLITAYELGKTQQ